MATFNATIVASSDDARESAGTMNLTGANITISANSIYAGLRFLNVTIPPGSTVTAATLSLNISSLTYDDIDLDMYAEDTDDAGTFTTAASNVSGRTLTTATVQWIEGSAGAGVQVSPDISTIIQEVIDRGGWASGNDIAIILRGRTNDCRFEAIDGASGTYSTLDITYTAPGGSGVPKHAMYYARARR